jgi:hypothetical protein
MRIPGAVVAGEGNGHGGNCLLHNRQDLDVVHVETPLLRKSTKHFAKENAPNYILLTRAIPYGASVYRYL